MTQLRVPLNVADAADAQALYAFLRAELARALPGQDDAARQISGLGVRDAAEIPLVRGAILSPADIDPIRAMDAIAGGLGLPHVHVPLGLTSGHDWQGADPRDWLDATRAPFGDRSVVTLTDIEALRIDRGEYSGSNSRLIRWPEDLSRSIAQLLAGEPLPSGGGKVVPTRGLLVVVAGQGDGLPHDPSATDWVDWRLALSVARHLAAAPLAHLTEPRDEDLVLTLLDALDGEHETHRRPGYRLDVDPAPLTYATAALRRADYDLNSAVGWLKRSAHEGLVALLESGGPGHTYTITPNSLRIPEAPAGRWVD